MATVTELQAELLAALLNSGVSSDTVIQAVRALEKQMKPDFGKLEKLVNGGEQAEHFSEASGGSDVQCTTPSLSDLKSNGQSIAEQLLRHDPWKSAKIIKQYMQQHNIPQREAVETTGLNQSHLSQHLNKGTPMKTQKRMTLYKWFEAKQKEVAAQYTNVSGKRHSDHDLSPSNSSSAYKRSRRNRFKWGHASTEILYGAYDSQRNPSKDERELLVKACNDAECEQRGIPLEQVNNLGPNLVTESRVYNWFANRRKEEAFKVKLAMDAGTYPVTGNGGIDHHTSRIDAKHAPNTPSIEKPIMPKPPPLPTFATHPLPKFNDTQSLEREVTPQTPVSSTPISTTSQLSTTPLARLPTMSLIKFESSPPPVTQATSVSYGHLQRPISVAFGAMPHQILTPAQLQVITGLVPSQMLPMSHAATGIVAQPGDIGTPGAIPPGHVTNLMLPSHLSSQPIPVHAVTLMSMTSGQPQVVYSMSSQPSVNSALISSTVSPSTVTAAPGVPLSVGSSSDVTIQHQSALPQITTVQSVTTMQPGNVNGSSLSNQISSPGVAPISIQSQAFVPSSVRCALSKQELTQTHVQSPGAIYTDTKNHCQ
ncbi:hepatocyte nuclear factor 1-beta-B-like isoform X2 [Dendronephthya gigantea]|uniref:hepatocyte nuclear factor 1-beta-B-like isoform X2 n=1 Tax=Dendronephthya gigantea TaxID=151771 RepID=UPI00106B92B3|nr:hepatocyte nuclear factor 1-beta-B-like isoform X2 [Dendronephthya gigantea]